ncbi:uncharacterized protein Z518_01118 [Rhinocladiella mackenziei CBS 650.93]|uniref:Uncharacterized protein n=1 Tax=Rhinocladiella mackenziei CBS 650.93 TaxID=1442369 RepID=A0A0D2G5G1_9EURO|nr:uncharacterized protein Z518_01118 [Rhinocladiella mackenziei CBS 650.93]KIX10037.1 hypothetical protein Z518_01118 [Rhinocladiella mackenziei CBS 650.93]
MALGISNLRPDGLVKVKSRDGLTLLLVRKLGVTGAHWEKTILPLNHLLKGLGNVPYALMNRAWFSSVEPATHIAREISASQSSSLVQTSLRMLPSYLVRSNQSQVESQRHL